MRLIKQLVAPAIPLVTVWFHEMDEGVHFGKSPVIVLALVQDDEDVSDDRVEGLSCDELPTGQWDPGESSPSRAENFLGLFPADTPDEELDRRAKIAFERKIDLDAKAAAAHKSRN